MKAWVKAATAVKKAAIKAGWHLPGQRYGKELARMNKPAPRDWQGGPPPTKVPSPLLMALLRGRSA